MNDLTSKLNIVRARIDDACRNSGRNPNTASLLAVSKLQSVEKIRQLYQSGQRHFGENYLQEALEKQKLLRDLSIEWHFIGPLQSNKTRDVARYFHWVQSIDRKKLLLRLSEQRPANLPPLNVCLQVNIDLEAQKSGVAPDEIQALAKIATALPGIRLRGLMAIPKAGPDGGAAKDSFQRVKALYDSLRAGGLDLDTLSMGMSADLEQAIAAGSTMVRIGTDLFGPRT